MDYRYFLTTVTLVIWLWASPSIAQPEAAAKDVTGQNVSSEFGLFFGNLLPDQIGGVTEVTGLGGFRGGYRLAPGSFAEATFTMGNGHGAEWKNFSLSARMDMPIENLVGLVFIGPDVTYYQGAGRSNRVIFGGHVGGGIQALLGGMTWFRADMKFAVSPGTSLFIGFGFVFRLSGGGTGAP